MATSQNQQYLSDLAQAGDPDQCCIALGGDLVTAADGTPLCSFQDYEYERHLACNYAQSVAIDSPTQGGQSAAGGLGNWLSANLGSLADSASTVIRAFQPEPPPPPPGTPTPAVEPRNNTGQIIGAVVVVAVLALVVYLIRRKK